MLERIIRAKILACGNARAIAGKVKDLIDRKKPRSQPGKPQAENHRKFIAKINTRIIANQKFGIATPS